MCVHLFIRFSFYYLIAHFRQITTTKKTAAAARVATPVCIILKTLAICLERQLVFHVVTSKSLEHQLVFHVVTSARLKRQSVFPIVMSMSSER